MGWRYVVGRADLGLGLNAKCAFPMALNVGKVIQTQTLSGVAVPHPTRSQLA
jgi:hypothetical protein